MRCKFKLTSITQQEGNVTKLGPDGLPAVDANGRRTTEPGQVWSITMAPVYANDDPKHENSVFWAYSPGGEFKLNTVNKAAVDKLELGREYYIDITPAAS